MKRAGMVLALTLVVGLVVGVFLVGKSVLDRGEGVHQPQPVALAPVSRPPRRTTPLALHEVKRIFVEGSYRDEGTAPGSRSVDPGSLTRAIERGERTAPVWSVDPDYVARAIADSHRIDGVQVVKSELEADAVLTVESQSKNSWKEFRIDTQTTHVRGNYQETTETMKARLRDHDTGQEIWKTAKTESYRWGTGSPLFKLVIQQLRQDREKSGAQQ